MRTTPQLAIALTLIATFFWGSNFQVTKFALASLPPWTASVERFFYAVICIFIFLAWKEGIHGKVLKQNWWTFIVLGAIGVAGFNGAFFVGLQSSNPVTAALIVATTPISANILEAIINRRLPGLLRVVGMVISLLGVALVITNGELNLGGMAQVVTGDILIFIGSLGWSIYTVGTRVLVKDATPLETTSWTMLFGAIILVFIAFFVESPVTALSSATFESHLACLYIGIGGSTIAYLFWNMGVAIRGAGKTAIFFNFVPIFALIIQVMMGNIPSLPQVIGVVITIVGVFLGQGSITGDKLFKGILSNR
ncbi:DMT family transporter [Xenorhabdus doucetiae]|uniref:Threonine/homoserine exporter RhtA n=1 Tax=Xenorhabdus doucetiae TaxID=351671 RepID=A0A068QU48_9GAMM|nr:DMT family transporter [Xenorhabdus doucetiae]TYO99116.1 EamA-like transporter family protein [Xenorhabdus doucetiae]CDG17370.1 putative permeased [Xenorhabdus doucetiae]